MDQRDEDLATLFQYLGIAAGRDKSDLPALTAEYLPNVCAFSQRYFEALFQRLPAGTVLVLDNYQEVSDLAPFQSVIRSAVPLLPPGMNLIVISRREPPAEMARLRLHGDLQVLDWATLRLTRPESAAVAELLQGDEISPDWVTQCFEQSDGWMAGFVLLLKGARQKLPGAEFGIPDAPDLLFDYFITDTLSESAEIDREILLQAALMPTFTVEWASRLTGLEGVGAVLEHLHRNNYFILKRCEGETVYEFHPLFRTFLLDYGRRSFSADTLNKLSCQAAEILAGNGMYGEAVDLFHQAECYDGLIALLTRPLNSRRGIASGRMLKIGLDTLRPGA